MPEALRFRPLGAGAGATAAVGNLSATGGPSVRFRPISATSSPSARPAPQTTAGEVPASPSPELGAARSANSLLGAAASLGDQRWLALGSQGAGAALNTVQGIEALLQGRPLQGALNLGAGLGSGTALAAPAGSGLETAGGALSGVTGLAGSGLSFAQGNVPGGVQGLIGSAGSLANLAPATTWLGGVPLSMSGGQLALQTAIAAEEMGTAAAGVGSALSGAGASLAGALGAIGIPLAVGKIAETVINAAIGEGPFAQTKLPFGRGNEFSSADNLASQTSKFRSIQGGNLLQAEIMKATNPTALLAMAAAGPQLAPHGEIQFWHPDFGHGGDWDDPQSPAFTQAVNTIARTGDPDLLRQFIGGIQINTGETGATAPNYVITDWWRRKLVSLLPEDHPVRQDMTGLFEPTPAAYLPEGRANSYLGALRNQFSNYLAAIGSRGVGAPFSSEQGIQGLMAGLAGDTNLATMFRPESELITTREQAERLVNAYINSIDPATIPGTPQWLSWNQPPPQL